MSEDKKTTCPSHTIPEAKTLNDNTAGRDAAAMNDATSGKTPGKPRSARNEDILPGILGKQLKAAYGELLNAPVPDAITDLIKKLKDKEPSPASTPEESCHDEDGQ